MVAKATCGCPKLYIYIPQPSTLKYVHIIRGFIYFNRPPQKYIIYLKTLISEMFSNISNIQESVLQMTS